MLIRQTFAYLPAQILGPLAQFATAIVLTYWLGAADYGLTMLIFASQELIFLLCLAWWTFYSMRYLGTHTDKAAQAAFRTTESGVILASALVQVLATIAIILTTEPRVSPAVYGGAIAFTISRSFLNLLSERARTAGAILDYSLIQILAPAGGLVLTLLAMPLLAPGPASVLLVFALVQAVIGGIVAARLGIAIHWGRYDRPLLRRAMLFGVPILISGLFGWVAANGIRFVIQGFEGPVMLGLLSVGWGLANRLSTMAAMLVTAAAYPLAVKAMERGEPDSARNQLSANSALLLGIIAPATCGIIAINEPFIRLLVAPEFQAATIAILPLALIGTSIRSLRMHGWDQIYLLFEAPKAMMIMEGAEAVLTTLLAILGFMQGGLVGAVAGVLVAAIVVALADYLYLSRRFGLKVPFFMFARILAAAGLMLLAVEALPLIGLPLTPQWGRIALAIACGAIVYGILIAAFFPALTRLALGKLKSGSF